MSTQLIPQSEQPELFGNRVVNELQFIEQDGKFLIAGVEICRRLGYAYPKQQAATVQNRHQNILESHSVVVKLTTTDGKKYETRAYDEAGARFFIAKCDMPQADELTMRMIEAFIRLRDERFERTERAKLLGLSFSYRRAVRDQVRMKVCRATGTEFADPRLMSIVFNALHKHFTIDSYKHLTDSQIPDVLDWLSNFPLPVELFLSRPQSIPARKIASHICGLLECLTFLDINLQRSLREQIQNWLNQIDTTSVGQMRQILPGLVKSFLSKSPETIH